MFAIVLHTKTQILIRFYGLDSNRLGVCLCLLWSSTDDNFSKHLNIDDRTFSLLCSSKGDPVFCRLFQAPFYFGVANTKIRREAETGERTFAKSRALVFACL